MGFSITWFAVPDKNREAFFKRFSLSLTGEKMDVPDALISTAYLDTGWTVLWYNNVTCPFLSERELKEVSKDYDIIRCLVEEHVMACSSELWSGGSRKWFLSHSSEDGSENLDLDGTMPESFNAIKEKMKKTQMAEGGADYFFEIPLCVAESIVGFKHDVVCKHMPEDVFYVMKRTAPSASKTGFFASIFGKK